MRVFKRIKNDRGSSNTVSFIAIILVVMIMLISFVDVGLYFNTRNQMQSAAENGARSIALYGGVDTVVRDYRGGDLPEDTVWNSIPQNLRDNTTTVIVEDSGIECFPESGKIKAGDKVSCEITYVYNGLAGRFGLFNLGKGKEEIAEGMKVIGTSVSEVTIE